MELVLNLLNEPAKSLFGYFLFAQFFACKIMPEMDSKHFNTSLLFKLSYYIHFLLLHLLAFASDFL